MHEEHHRARTTTHKLARLALFSFTLTFIASRAFILLIMSRQIPNFYFYLRGVHVHHLNYGIFLLAGVAGYSVLMRPVGRAGEFTALAYGIAMALTFDEFGMWLHLGGSYWQRASVDAVIIVAAVLGLFGYVRSFQHFRSHHRWSSIVLMLALIGFGWVVFAAGTRLGAMVGPSLHALEESSMP